MDILKIEAEGITTSFRYPHFMQGVHPTFEMPPPATIYGHICSALGEWVTPDGLQFAYYFSYDCLFDDVEHIHLLSASRGNLPGTRIPKSVSGIIMPFKRSVLFRPRLVLYLNKPEWKTAFQSPCYPVVLGRSQDLFTYTRITTLTLTSAQEAYFEHTLAPYQMALQTGRGYVVLMPRFLDYHNKRTPTFARYVVLHNRVYSRELIRQDGATPELYWVDPESPEVNGARLGLLFHTFVGDYDDSIVMAEVVG